MQNSKLPSLMEINNNVTYVGGQNLSCHSSISLKNMPTYINFSGNDYNPLKENNSKKIDIIESNDTNHMDWDLHKHSTSSPNECFNFVHNKWQSPHIPDPHEDLTTRYQKNFDVNCFTYHFTGDQYNSYIPVGDIYEKDINKKVHEIEELDEEINRLYKNKDLRQYECIKTKRNQALSEWSKKKSELAKLKEIQKDAVLWFKYYDQPHINGSLLTELAEHEVCKQRDIIDKYYEIYQNRSMN